MADLIARGLGKKANDDVATLTTTVAGKAEQTALDTANTNITNINTEITNARGGKASLSEKVTEINASLAQNLNKRLYFLDAYNNFFGGQANDFVTGQSTTPTTTTASASIGANVISLADVTGLSAGVVLVVNGATANQQLVSVSSVAGNDVTITPVLTAAVANGATISPLWVNSSHLTAGGYDAWAYFITNAKDELGNDILKGTAPKVTLLGDSWIANDTALYDAVLAKIPGATVVNAGVSGNTSTAMLARFDTDVPSDSDYVLFNEPGVNDVYQLYPQSTYANNLELLVKKIRAIGATPIFIGCPPLSDYVNVAYVRNNEMIAQIGDGKEFPAIPGNAVVRPVQPDVNSFAIGVNNLRQVTTGTKNTALGIDALKDVTTGLSNLGIGKSAGRALTTGSQNVAIGESALYNDVSSPDNVAIGQSALFSTTSRGNVGIGCNTGFSLSSGQYNTMIGKGAGYESAGVAGDATTTGANNTFIGYQAGSLPTKSNVVAIGYKAKGSGSNSIAIGGDVVASHDGAVAIGKDNANTSATSTAANDFVLGTALHNVKIQGRLNVAQRTPSGTADVQGNVGDITSDDNYIYVKTSTGWKRSALSTW